MSYSKIDNILNSWANKHKLHIHKEYQDTEVRSIDIVSFHGNRFQLWIDIPSKNGDVKIHIWDMNKKIKHYFASRVSLEEKLEAAYQQAKIWF